MPELLKPTGLTNEIRKDHNAMRAIAGHTQVKPDKREEAQRGLADDMNKLPAGVNNLGLKIDTESNVITDALNFTPPTIQWRESVQPRDDGTFIGARAKIYQKEATLGNWAIVYEKVEDAKAALACMNKACKSIDVKVPDPVKIAVKLFNDQTKKPLNRGEKIKAITDKLSKKEYENVSIFFIILEKRVADQVYDNVKDHCQKVLGKQSQFFSNMAKKEDLSVMTNVILGMAVKLGINIYQIPKVPGMNTNKKDSVMLVGADICHLNGRDSVVSVIATSNSTYTTYYSASAFTNHRGDDLMFAVANLVQRCRANYVKQNGHEPGTIIFYRDGIGMGSYDEVKAKEIAPILQELTSKAANPEVVPKLTYIIVNKRINDRFYTEVRGELKNPEGGLIIKSAVTNPMGFDFFMVAQKVQMGTATPTHYECLYNDSTLSSDQLYIQSYYSCFNYFNWRGPVKVPAVVQYAHKQAELLARSTPRRKNNTEKYIEIHENLSTSLFFI